MITGTEWVRRRKRISPIGTGTGCFRKIKHGNGTGTGRIGKTGTETERRHNDIQNLVRVRDWDGLISNCSDGYGIRTLTRTPESVELHD